MLTPCLSMNTRKPTSKSTFVKKKEPAGFLLCDTDKVTVGNPQPDPLA